MTKRTGLAHALFVNGWDLSGGINSVGSIGGGPTNTLDMTDITQLAMDRAGGVRDGHLDVTSFLDSAVGSAHSQFSLLNLSNEIQTYCAGTALGDPAACLVAKQANYDGTRGTDGSLLFNTQGLATAGLGLEWQEQLTAGKITQGSAGAVAGVDFTSATAFGLQAYLHVFAFTGTSATIKLQESSDNGVGDAFADVVGGGFAVVNTAHTAQRIQTTRALAVERYLRVLTTGTFSNLVFAVTVAKNITEVIFNA